MLIGKQVVVHEKLAPESAALSLPDGRLNEGESDIWRCVAQHLDELPGVDHWVSWLADGIDSDSRRAFVHWHLPDSNGVPYPVLFTCGVHAQVRRMGYAKRAMREAIQQIVGLGYLKIAITWGPRLKLQPCQMGVVIAGLGPVQLLDFEEARREICEAYLWRNLNGEL